jgi:hypothetical protein
LDYSVREAMKHPVSADEPLPEVWLSWDYNPGEEVVPKMAVDRDNIPLVLWLPKFLADAAHVRTVSCSPHCILT